MIQSLIEGILYKIVKSATLSGANISTVLISCSKVISLLILISIDICENIQNFIFLSKRKKLEITYHCPLNFQNNPKTYGIFLN